MDEMKTGVETQVDTYEFAGETYANLNENIVVRRRSGLISKPIKDLPIGKNFAVGYGQIFSKNDKGELLFQYSEFLNVHSESDYFTKDFQEERIKAFINELTAYGNVEVYPDRDYQVYVEIPITNAVDLKDANDQAQKIIDAVEANVKQELSKQFDIAKEEEKAKKKLEEEIQAKQKPYTYNNKTYPRGDGMPIIPIHDLFEIPIMELVRIRSIGVVDEIDANGNPVNLLFGLSVKNKNLMLAHVEIVADSVFSGFIYAGTIDQITKKPYVEILNTNLNSDDFTIEILITASGENRDVMLNKILATLNK